MHALRELHAAGRVRLELAKHSIAPILLGVFLLFACEQPQADRPAARAESPRLSAVPLAVAHDSTWRAHSIDSLQLHLWLPQGVTFDFRGTTPKCIGWNQQPFLYDESAPATVPIYFSRGSLGQALEAVGIGRNEEESRFVSYGRQGIASGLSARWGHRSIVFSGSRMVGVPISEEGGMALDETAVLTSVVRRPDGCWVIFTFDDYAESLHAEELWHMMEAVRFPGEDPRLALPGQPFVGSFDFADRVRKVVAATSGMCLLDPPPNLQVGTPVVLLRRSASDERYNVIAGEPQHTCAAGRGRALEGSLDLLPLPLAAIGLIAPGAISFRGDSLIMDLDGNGRLETLRDCLAGGANELSLVERIMDNDSVRFRMRVSERTSNEPCGN